MINVSGIIGPVASIERLAMVGRPGRLPAQLVAHTLFYFTQKGDLVFDPMAGGGIVPDTCLAFNRKCSKTMIIRLTPMPPNLEIVHGI